MTRDEQKKLKELKKMLPKILKDKIKKYKFKKKDFMIYFRKNELFFDLLIDVKVLSDGKCYCTTIEEIKPLWLDELLWDLLKIESNKEGPLSLRAIGAFTVTGSEIYEAKSELAKWSVTELEEVIDTYLEHFYHSVQESKVHDFYDNLSTSPYHSELRKLLSFIHDHKYEEALACLNVSEDGGFRNGDISINSAIEAYCLDNLSNC